MTVHHEDILGTQQDDASGLQTSAGDTSRRKARATSSGATCAKAGVAQARVVTIIARVVHRACAMRRSGSREVMRQGLVDQDDWDVDGVQHFQRDRAQQQAPRRPEASRSHDDVVALMLGSVCLD
ncbi:hypothetical protein G6F62_014661 [Rhizopus arrhizus]|nr:hypothetical protein G6F62_014661 [Rhizopus arrhizus]